MLKGGQIDSFNLKDASPLSKLERTVKKHANLNQNQTSQNSHDRFDRMSIISQDSVATTGRLLDKLGLEDEEFDDMTSMYTQTDSVVSDNDSQHSISAPASEFRSLRPMLMTQRANDMRTHALNSAIALGSKVNQTNHRSPKLVQNNFSRLSFHASDPSIDQSFTDEENEDDNETIYTNTNTEGTASVRSSAPPTPGSTTPSKSAFSSSVHGRQPSFEVNPNYNTSQQGEIYKPTRNTQHYHSVSNPSDALSYSNKNLPQTPTSPITKAFHSRFYHATAPQTISRIDPPSPIRISQEYVTPPLTSSATQPIFPSSNNDMESASKRALGDLLRTPSAPSLRKPAQAPPILPNQMRNRSKQHPQGIPHVSYGTPKQNEVVGMIPTPRSHPSPNEFSKAPQGRFPPQQSFQFPPPHPYTLPNSHPGSSSSLNSRSSRSRSNTASNGIVPQVIQVPGSQYPPQLQTLRKMSATSSTSAKSSGSKNSSSETVSTNPPSIQGGNPQPELTHKRNNSSFSAYRTPPQGSSTDQLSVSTQSTQPVYPNQQSQSQSQLQSQQTEKQAQLQMQAQAPVQVQQIQQQQPLSPAKDPHRIPEWLVQDSTVIPSNQQPVSTLTPEMRVAMAVALRKSGQSKEAAYQLQIASNQENREAMLLYGLSLRYGYGVKKDLNVSFVWICKAGSIDPKKKYEFKIDPKELKAKSGNKPIPAQEPDCSIYFEIGQAFLNGWGCDRNIKQGVEFIEKSGSLGYTDAMCEAGMIWASKKRNSVKKDTKRAAAWFRLADLCGAELIGSDWIYNKKYL